MHLLRINFLLWLTVLWLMCCLTARSQTITVDTTLHPKETIAKHFFGRGMTILDYSFVGDKRQIGYFKDASGILGMNGGLVLSTGLAWDASRANSYGMAGVPDANTIINSNPTPDTNLIKLAGIGQDLYDRCYLKIRFRTSGDSVKFRFLFASEEYPDFAPPNPVTYNDVFGFFLQGPGFPQMTNVALLPSTNIPVSIDNVNAVTNDNYYVSSQFQADPRYRIFAFNGGTVVIPIEVQLFPCSEYTILIAVADVGDPSRDSAIFLESNSFSGNGYSVRAVSNLFDSNGKPVTREGCGQDVAGFIFDRPDSVAAFNLGLQVNGTAVNGTDYNPLGNQVRFNAGQGSVFLPINGLFDNIFEPTESVIVSINDPNCPGQVLRDTLSIVNRDPLNVVTNNNQKFVQLCGAQRMDLSAQVMNRPAEEVFYEWLNGVKPPSPSGGINVQVNGDTTFIIRYIDICPQVPTVTDTVRVRTTYDLELNITRDTTLCEGQSIQLTATASGGDGNYTYAWDNGLGNGNVHDVAPAVTTDYSVTLTDNCGSVPQIKTVKVTVIPTGTPLRIATAPPADTTICPNTEFTLKIVAAGGTGNYKYLWADNLGTTDEIKVTPLTDTRYTVTVSDECTQVQRSFVIRPAKKLELQQVPITSPCINGTTQLKIQVNGGLAPYVYSWTSTDQFSSNEEAPNVTLARTATFTVTVRDVCDSVATEIFVLSPLPALALTVPTDYITCPDQPITVTLAATGGDGNYTFTWSDGLGTGASKQLPATEKTYSVTLTDGCDSPEQVYNIRVRIPVSAAASFILLPDTVCINSAATVIYDGTVLAGAEYLWDFGTLTRLSGTGEGPYQVSGGTVGIYPIKLNVVYQSCTSAVFIDTLTVVNTPTADFEQPAAQCFGGNSFSFNNLTADNPNYKYEWTFGAQAVPPVSSERNPQNISFTNAGIFPVTLKVSVGGCENFITKEVTVLPSADAPQVTAPEICTGYPAVAFIVDPQNDVTYNWFDAPTGGTPIATGAEFISGDLATSTTFYVEATTSGGCPSFPRTVVTVKVNGVGSIDIQVNEQDVFVPLSSITFKAIIDDTTQADHYFWTFGDGKNSILKEPVHTYQDYGTYDVTLTITDDATGCFNSVVKKQFITVREGTLLQVPSAFSPNDDLINDEFFITHRLITEFNIQIFNFWGNKVFESNDVNFIWYGYDETSSAERNRREILPRGVYVYIINAKSYDGKPLDLKGTITLVR